MVNTYLHIDHITKSYKNKTALSSVDLTFQRGEIITLLGPNGAGKSTLINLISGLIAPDAGKITYFSESSLTRAVKNRMGIMLQEVQMIDKVRVGEIIRLFRSYYTHPLSYPEILELSDLTRYEKTYANQLSGGETRRLQFALALCGNPDILLLDEPTVGMDIDARKRFWQNIKSLGLDQKLLLLTTHDLQEAQEIADRLILLANGTIVIDGHYEALNQASRLTRITLTSNRFFNEEEQHSLPLIHKSESQDNKHTIWIDNADAFLDALYTTGIKQANAITVQAIQTGGLHELYQSLLPTS